MGPNKQDGSTVLCQCSPPSQSQSTNSLLPSVCSAVNFLENRGAAQKSFEFLISPRHPPDGHDATSLHGLDFMTTVRLRTPSRHRPPPLDRTSEAPMAWARVSLSKAKTRRRV